MRTLAALTAAAGLAAAGPAGHPPPGPAGEAPGPAEYTPPAQCLKSVMAVLSRDGGKLLRTLVTRSDAFGDVWRADFSTPGYSDALVNRAICWSDQTLILMHQKIAPLPTTAGALHRPAALRCAYTELEDPCRDEPVRMVWLCQRPALMLYADGRVRPASAGEALDVSFVNRGPSETEAAWIRRCEPHGGPYRGDD
ncbi:MAG TPA: hypothetical protein VG939_06080 [Caulobacteraceae bacterium]|nr:hypothetical protein [Caulobacteraceae bacterium]